MEGGKTKLSRRPTINALDDGCLMHIFSFLPPLPGPLLSFYSLSVVVQSLLSTWFYCSDTVFADRFNTALVCHRWRFLVCHPRLWLRVDRSVTAKPETGVFSNLESAITAARPGDTILISSSGSHLACNVQIKKPLCLYVMLIITCVAFVQIGSGDDPDDTVLICSRGFNSALEFLSTCKISNLTVKAELGCCLLHRSGKLTIEGCVLQCEEHPLDHLSCAIVSTANAMPLASELLASVKPAEGGSSVSVSRTRIEGGAKAVLTSGTLALQQVRVMYARTALFFWFNVSQRLPVPMESRKELTGKLM
ncbi:F-box protein [Nymphaea thermarum]|nr:F-box protein [Nymphaea thermarum]